MITTLKNKKFNSLMDKIFGNTQQQRETITSAMPKASAGRPPKNSAPWARNFETKEEALNKANISHQQASQYELMAANPDIVEKMQKIEISEPLKENIPSYRQCNLKDFYSVIRLSFGMGIDYAMKDDNGTPLKSWFTIDDVVNELKKKGFLIMESQARNYLETFVRQNYFEKRESISGIEYRRKTWFVKL